MLAFFNLPAGAAEWLYDGDGGKLKALPDWMDEQDELHFYPGTKETPLASGNTVIINYDPLAGGMTDPGWAVGGLSEAGIAEKNIVKMLNGDVGVLLGGLSRCGGANDNAVVISGGSAADVSGGIVFNGLGSGPLQASVSLSASGNTVELGEGVVIYRHVYGGYAAARAYSGAGDAAAAAAANGDAVSISGGTVYGHVYGGLANAEAASDGAGTASASSGASDGAIEIRESAVGGRVYGGLATAAAEGAAANAAAIASGNAVDAGDSAIDWDVYGGAAAAATASGNRATIGGSTVWEHVYGGYAVANAETEGFGSASANAAASGNKVKISGSKVRLSVYGGQAGSDGSGELLSNASDNTVEISDSIVDEDVYGGYASAYADAGEGNAGARAAVSDNTVSISDSTVNGFVHGGHAYAGTYSTQVNTGARAAASGNTVSIGGGTIDSDIYGGRAYTTIYGGTAAADASNNTVSLSGRLSVVNSWIHGGYAFAENLRDGSVTATASGNTVSISDITLDGNIFGGYAAAESFGGMAAAFATHNTVSLSGELNLANSWIYGGYGRARGTVETSDFFTGNRLEVRSRNISVLGVDNFEFYDFYLPEDVSAADTMLNVASGVDMEGSEAAIFMQGAANLSVGDIVTLIESDGGVSKPLNDGEIVSAKLGALLMYDFLVYVSDDDANLYASYEGGGLSRGSGALDNSRLGPMAFLSQGADLVSMLEYFEVSRDKRPGYTGFAAVMGGSSTYETGSDVEVKGWSLIAGVTKDVPTGGNSLKLSAFIEAGWGDYDTDNSYSGTSVKGSGDMDYFGGGLHARYMWLNGEKPGGWYADGSVKVGKVNSDFSCWDLTDQFGRHLNYDVDSTYYGAHVGLGREWKLNEKTTIDVSSKFLWTRLEGDEFTTSTGDRVRFDDVDSYRWRTGFRVTSERTERVSIYGGLYYEYEFDGDAAGWLFGTYSLDKSSLGGGTGIGELGVTFKPSAGNDRLTMGIGAQGYVGTREGVSGVLKLQYTF